MLSATWCRFWYIELDWFLIKIIPIIGQCKALKNVFLVYHRRAENSTNPELRSLFVKLFFFYTIKIRANSRRLVNAMLKYFSKFQVKFLLRIYFQSESWKQSHSFQSSHLAHNLCPINCESSIWLLLILSAFLYHSSLSFPLLFSLDKMSRFFRESNGWY